MVIEKVVIYHYLYDNRDPDIVRFCYEVKEGLQTEQARNNEMKTFVDYLMKNY